MQLGICCGVLLLVGSGRLWEGILGVCGLPHGGAGFKKVIFLVLAGVFKQDFAFQGRPESISEATW